MSHREKFCQLALSKLGSQVLWNNDGPHVFDCSGLVAWALHSVGGKDIRATHNAQRMADETPNLATFASPTPMPGDLAFFGDGPGHIIHVAIWLKDGEVLSADGATSRITRLEDVRPNALVRLHDGTAFRNDFVGLHRNTFLDGIQ